MALLLVLIAAVVAFTISSAYLSSQATTITISQNATNLAQARYVAESGLRIATAYVKRTSTWRTDRVHGLWVSNSAYSPGTFTVIGYDGADVDGDGTIEQPGEGDGDLADDASDLLTLVVTGSVNGATHIVRAVISSGTAVPTPQHHWKFDETTGAIAVDSEGGIDGALTNFTTSDAKWAAGQVDNALTFDENNDHVVLSGLPNLTGDFSITAWIRPNNVNGDQRIFCDDRNNSGGFAFSLGDGGAGMLRLFGRSINPVIIDSSAVVTAGAWQFVAAVHDANARVRRLYRNGVLVGGDSSAYSGTWGTDSGLAAIGGEVDGTSEGVAQWRFGGSMDDVRIYDQALSVEQITAIYAATGSTGSGALYDFATATQGTDAFAYDGESGTKIPTAVNLPGTVLSTGEYDGIELDDAASHSYAVGSNNQYAQMRFVVQIAESAVSVTQLDVSLIGRNVNANNGRTDGIELHIWNYASAAYESLAVSADTESEVTLTAAVSSNPTDYVGGAGSNTVTLLAASRDRRTGSSSNTLYVDYMSVQVTAAIGTSSSFAVHWVK